MKAIGKPSGEHNRIALVRDIANVEPILDCLVAVSHGFQRK